MEETRSSYSYVPIISKASDIIDYIALKRGGVAAGEIMRHFDIPKTSCYRILHTLSGCGLLSFSAADSLYYLGTKFSHFSIFSDHKHQILREASIPHLRELALSAGETAKLSILSNLECYVLQRIDGPRDVKVRVEIGTNFPLHAGASSKILFLSLDESVREPIIRGGLAKYTRCTITEPEKMRAELNAIAAQGYAVDSGEFTPGIGAVACPVTNHLGRTIAAVSVAYMTLGTEGDPVDTFLPCIKKAAEQISHDFISASMEPTM
ncbi:MAG: IclR family transcriptional regulator [Lachnospiraceae bacterium]|nr:IclR family transcriptional regulator [Lachnospiraceae bacterium]